MCQVSDSEATMTTEELYLQQIRDGIHRLYMMLVLITCELFYMLLWK